MSPDTAAADAVSVLKSHWALWDAASPSPLNHFASAMALRAVAVPATIEIVYETNFNAPPSAPDSAAEAAISDFSVLNPPVSLAHAPETCVTAGVSASTALVIFLVLVISFSAHGPPAPAFIFSFAFAKAAPASSAAFPILRRAASSEPLSLTRSCMVFLAAPKVPMNSAAIPAFMEIICASTEAMPLSLLSDCASSPAMSPAPRTPPVPAFSLMNDLSPAMSVVLVLPAVSMRQVHLEGALLLIDEVDVGSAQLERHDAIPVRQSERHVPCAVLGDPEMNEVGDVIQLRGRTTPWDSGAAAVLGWHHGKLGFL